jgi:hypothetical protein
MSAERGDCALKRVHGTASQQYRVREHDPTLDLARHRQLLGLEATAVFSNRLLVDGLI